MKYLKFILAISLIKLYCGKDPALEAEQAFEAANYNKAINLYSQILQEDSTNRGVKEKLFLAYFYRGQVLYNKTKNVDAFYLNFQKAVQNAPDTLTPPLQKTFSNMYYELAAAYISAKPDNDVQKDKYLDDAIHLCKQALEKDSTNLKADSLLSAIRESHFQELIDKAKEHFNRARRTDEVNYYFSADAYLNTAANFYEKNAEIISLKLKIRAKTFAVLNSKDGVALAVLGKKHTKGKLLLDIEIYNFLPNSVRLVLDNFRLFDRNGTSYPLDKKEMDLFYHDRSLKNTMLNGQNRFTGGYLVFTVPQEYKINYLEYRYGQGVSRKYFP